MTQTHKATISRLTISGFKSFADEVSLDLLPGLTGIVGPNGCGKSNIVESLRWVMGESSARALRGGDSDDLIFAGTQGRPARNIAKVTLRLTNSQGLAPAPFQNSDELEITRQAERNSGNLYRINQKTMRAKDVQIIFADLASGARSSSIISQNRVGELINAKPEERRLLLEEAAGITGLHVRRHDAELKLKQAENNLERVGEHRQNLEERLQTLSEQAKNALHYREISENIRLYEEKLLILNHQRAHLTLENNQKALEDNNREKEKIQNILEEIKSEQNTLINKKTILIQKIEEMRPILQNKRIEKEITSNNLEHILKNDREKEAQIQNIKENITENENQHHLIEKESSEFLSKLNHIIPELDNTQNNISDIESNILRLEEEYRKIHHHYESLNDIYQNNYINYKDIHGKYHLIKENLVHERKIRAHLHQQMTHLHEEKESLSKKESEFSNLQEISDEFETLKKELANINEKLQEIHIEEEVTHHAILSQKEKEEKLLQRKIILQQNIEKINQRQKEEQNKKETYQSQIISKEKEDDFNHQKDDYEKSLLSLEEKENHTLKNYELLNNHLRHVQKTIEETNASLIFYQKEKERLTTHLHDKEQALLTAKETYQTLIEEEQALPDYEKLRHSLEESYANVQKYHNKITQHSKIIEQLKKKKEKIAETLLKTHSLKLEIESEMNGLSKTLNNHSHNKSQHTSLIEKILCPPDYQKALATALSDNLDATLLANAESIFSQKMQRGWYFLPPPSKKHPSLSHKTLADYITAPKELQRALQSFFLLKDDDDALTLQKQLHQGESLIDKNGNLWRWDGFIQTQHAASPAEIKLIQTQRLHELREDLTHYENKSSTIKEELHNVSLLLEKEVETSHSLEKDYHIHLKEKENYDTSFKELDNKRSYLQIRKEQLSNYIENITNEYHLFSETSAEIIDKITLLPNLEELSSQEEVLSQKFKKAQTDLHQCRDEKQSLQKNYHLFLQKKDSILLQHHNALKQIALLDDYATQHIEELNNLQKEYAALNEHHLQDALKNLMEKHSFYKETKAAILQEKHHLEGKIAKISSEIKAKQQDYQNYKNNLLIITEKLNNALQHIQQEEEKISALIKQEEEFHARLTELPSLEEQKNALDGVKEKYQLSKNKLDELLTELTAHKEKEALLTQEKQKLSHQIDMHEKTLHYITKNLSELRTRLKTLSEENLSQSNSLKADYEKQVENLQQLEQEFSSLEESLKHLSLREETNHKNIRHTQEELQKSNTHSIRLSERLKQAEYALETLQNDSPLPESSLLKESHISETDHKIRQMIQNSQNEREKLGAVNLCAEEEFSQLNANYQTLLQEQTDLTKAISRLRKAVNTLSREGRERLTKTFTEINEHFQKLFTRMFGGGNAHLKLVGHEDPLEAGLEIFAQPPGKKLTSLSLLSGGEQALTALSLIFSAFYCTPAPLYILDEVDAPLDDANVERFCSLLTEISQKTGTYFLVITHHQLTMAHMDRLFGITMQERGVSKILSVNLSESIQLSNS